MTLTDTHAHLYAEQFNDDRDEMVQRALEAGVTRLFLPNIDSGSIEPMLQLSQKYPEHCFPMMGLHPCSVGDNVEEELQQVERYLFEESGRNTFCAVGEIGLDYYWDTTYKAQQQDAFRRQINWALQLEKPIAIHVRDSFDDAFEIVKEMHGGKLRGVFHCFTGGAAEAEKVMSLDTFYMGLGGVLTFKNSGLDTTAKDIPLKYLLLETDAPYLAPTPNRGKRNESAWVKLVAQKLADIKEMSIEEVAEITTQNSIQLFGR